MAAGRPPPGTPGPCRTAAPGEGGGGHVKVTGHGSATVNRERKLKDGNKKWFALVIKMVGPAQWSVDQIQSHIWTADVHDGLSSFTLSDLIAIQQRGINVRSES